MQVGEFSAARQVLEAAALAHGTHVQQKFAGTAGGPSGLTTEHSDVVGCCQSTPFVLHGCTEVGTRRRSGSSR